MKFEIPSGARRILQPLTDAGYEAYLVGGCVRDLLQGVEPHDWDICTSARPGETEAAPPDLVLRLTMLLHDIGKPNCKSTDEKGIDPGPEVGQVLERVLNGEIQNEQDVLLKLIGRTI